MRKLKENQQTLEINLDYIGNEYISSNSPMNSRKNKIEYKNKDIGYNQFDQWTVKRKVSNRGVSKGNYSKVMNSERKQSGKEQVYKISSPQNKVSKGDNRSKAVNNSNKINVNKQQPIYNFNFAVSPVKSKNKQSSRK